MSEETKKPAPLDGVTACDFILIYLRMTPEERVAVRGLFDKFDAMLKWEAARD